MLSLHKKISKAHTNKFTLSLQNLVSSSAVIAMSFDDNLDPVLSDPATSSGGMVLNGSFQIKTPAYKGDQGTYRVGLGTITNGVYEIATYILAEPAYQTIDVQPVMKFYVNVNKIEKGAGVHFVSKSRTSALCDATTSIKDFTVVYRSDGLWKVNGKLQEG